jgi:hypothetical protein
MLSDLLKRKTKMGDSRSSSPAGFITILQALMQLLGRYKDFPNKRTFLYPIA